MRLLRYREEKLITQSLCHTQVGKTQELENLKSQVAS